MALDQEVKSKYYQKWKKDGDTGSAEVQIALIKLSKLKI